MSIDNTNVSVHLGKVSQYKSTYDPTLLVKEPRINNRKHIGLTNDSLPFVGVDVWNAYECSFLLENGRPVSCQLKIVYPADSDYIVESKSLKLYLNSFNMQKMPGYVTRALEKFRQVVSADLTELLGAGVTVTAFNDTNPECRTPYRYAYTTLETWPLVDDIKFSIYKETESLLQTEETFISCFSYHSALLKSNCRVTSQPDWGDIFIDYRVNPETKRTVTPESLLQYIVSFRDECHFHEEIAETIYSRLYKLLDPVSLSVVCLYARRGGIDINPIRMSHWNVSNSLIDTVRSIKPHVKTAKQ